MSSHQRNMPNAILSLVGKRITRWQFVGEICRCLMLQTMRRTSLISGLFYAENFISVASEQELLDGVDQSEWLPDLKRRVQQYGYKYDYKSRSIDHTMFLGQLPVWSTEITKRLVDEGYFEISPDQLIVNEYQSGQGISAHVDCEPCFQDTIGSVTIGSGCYMELKSLETCERRSVYLQPRSLIILSSEARYQWTHAIAKRTFDDVDGVRIPRSRRVSLTFRNVVIDESE